MAVVGTAEQTGDFVQSPDPRKRGHRMKNKWVKLRAEDEMTVRWKAIAEDRNQTLSAFVVSAVEAAIVGKIDQATLDQHLRAIRADSNAAYEAPTIEEARRHIDMMRKRIAVLRGIER
jgi:hypothetical protein